MLFQIHSTIKKIFFFIYTTLNFKISCDIHRCHKKQLSLDLTPDSTPSSYLVLTYVFLLSLYKFGSCPFD